MSRRATVCSFIHLLAGSLLVAWVTLPVCLGQSGDDDALLWRETGHWRTSNHTNNWAVLLCTSRFWFNYRHMANTLSIYHTVKRLGIPDSNIILMLADDMACNPRNPRPSAVFNNKDQGLNLYGSYIEVDYRGYEVTVENFLRVLTGRHEQAVPNSKRLMTDKNSNILVMLTGHGGDEFMKFQDDEELMAQDLADAIGQMHEKGRYNELLLFMETCEAATMWKRVYSPNVIGMASSKLGEKSYSHHSSGQLGVSVIDRFTYHTLMFFESIQDSSAEASMEQLFVYFQGKSLASTATFLTDLFPWQLNRVRVTDFFGAVLDTTPIQLVYPLEPLMDPLADQASSADRGRGRGPAPGPDGQAARSSGSQGQQHMKDGHGGALLLSVAVGLMLVVAFAAILASQPDLERLTLVD